MPALLMNVTSDRGATRSSLAAYENRCIQAGHGVGAFSKASCLETLAQKRQRQRMLSSIQDRDCSSNQLLDPRVTEREEVDRPCASGFGRGRETSVCGNEQDGNLGVGGLGRADSAEQRHPVAAWHPKVADHEIEVVELKLLPRLQAIGDLDHLVAGLLELGSDELASGVAIIDHEDDRFGGR